MRSGTDGLRLRQHSAGAPRASASAASAGRASSLADRCAASTAVRSQHAGGRLRASRHEDAGARGGERRACQARPFCGLAPTSERADLRSPASPRTGSGAGLWRWALALFVVGWIFQFVGHWYEKKPPEFFKDWRFLFVGLRWWFAKLRGRA